MLTQEAFNVLLIGIVVNGIVVIALLIAPRLRGRRRRRDQAAPSANGTASGRLGSASAGDDPGRPWFPANRAPRPDGGHGTMAAHPSDALPELASPGTWTTWLDEEHARALRYHRPATLVLVELAGLHRLAERIGESGADRLIPPVAATMRRHARNADRLARLGPTRFGVLLVETNEISAINYIERIRSACDVWLAAGAVALRLSIGWAEIRADRTADESAAEAERRLYAERRRAGSDDTATAQETDGPVVLQASGA